MELKQIRNQANLPNLDSEGTFSKPIDDVKRSTEWWNDVTPFERLHIHHTLASVRRYAHFHPFPNFIPTNALDLSLSSCYHHDEEHFPDPIDTLLQPETVGLSTWRRLRNTKFVLPGEDPRVASLKEISASDEDNAFGSKKKFKKKLPYKYIANHPVLISGVVERVHPSYVKLMNSSHHAPQTNAGYSRQSGDGNVFVY